MSSIDASTIRKSSRRSLLTGVAGGLVAAATGRWHDQGVAAQLGAIDIVVVQTDDMRYSDWDALPRTTALADENGTFFEGFYANSPICGASRATLLTGMHPHKSGVWQNKGKHGGVDGFKRQGLGPRTVFANLPGEYRSGFVGKFTNNYREGNRYRVPGVNRWWVVDSQAYRGMAVNDDGQWKTPPGYATNLETSVAVRFLSSTQEPVCLFVNPVAPHFPAEFPKADRNAPATGVPRNDAFNETDVSDKPRDIRQRRTVPAAKMDKRCRDRMRSLASVDRMVVALHQGLVARGTPFVLFVTSDHGFGLGEHRVVEKQEPYEAITRVGLAAIGMTFPNPQRICSTVDLTATIAALAGARTQMPWLAGQDLRDDWDGDALIQMKGKWSGFVNRTEKYVERMTGEREYYDLTKDPHELDNLLADWEGHSPDPQLTPERQADLRQRLESLLA